MALVHLRDSCSHNWWCRRPFRHVDVLAVLAEDRRCARVRGCLRLCRIDLGIVNLDVIEIVGIPGVTTMLLRGPADPRRRQ
eukprot:2592833-Pyramimonas_sp.AAC.1